MSTAETDHEYRQRAFMILLKSGGVCTSIFTTSAGAGQVVPVAAVALNGALPVEDHLALHDRLVAWLRRTADDLETALEPTDEDLAALLETDDTEDTP